ncbi:MAG: hypothetical protein ABIO21_05265 [Pseudomonas sp.]
MEIRTQYDLAKISIIIGTLARGQVWAGHSYVSASGKATAVHEVQCAFLEGDERIFIAANKGQHDQIKSALNSCGVTNVSSLIDLLRRAHKLFILPTDQRHKLGIVHYYEEQDSTAYGVLHAFDPSFNVAPITDEAVVKIKNIIAIPDDARNPEGISSKDIWLYKKLSGKDISTKIAMPRGTLETAKKPTNINTQTVCIVENTEDSHAELALLKFFTQGIIEGTFTQSAIYLGGRKIACANCETWITKYQTLLDAGLTLHVPADGRTSTKTNPGTCPSEFVPALVPLVPPPPTLKIRIADPLFKILFNGEAIASAKWPAVVVPAP